MTFEQELQVLVDKYNLSDVEITYKKKVTLSAQPQQHDPLAIHTESVTKDPLLDKYLGGTTGTATS